MSAGRWIFLCLTLPLTAAACMGAVDCNSKYCADCACVNQQCVCADGWSGVQCETPFCVDRSSCNNHGNCVNTAHSITCSCDAGWSGDRCLQATCSLVCAHGGSPNSACTECEGCLGAWKGATDLGVPFNAFANKTATASIAINEYMCDLGLTYGSSLPKQDTNCSVNLASVFYSVNCSSLSAVAVYEYVNTSNLQDRRFSTSASVPFPDFKLWTSSSFCVVSSTSPFLNTSLPVYASELFLDGTSCRSFLSLDVLAYKPCVSWDSAVSPSLLVAQLNSIITDAVDALADIQPLKPIQGGIGFGVSSVSGSLVSLPVLELTYSNQTWNGYHYPNEIKVLPVQNPGDQCDTQVFPSITSYAAFVSSLLANNQGQNGVFPDSLENMLSFFGARGDNSVSVVTDFWALYKLELLNVSNIRLSKYAERAIEMLPPKYEMNKDLFTKFFEMFGTSYVVEGAGGGWIAQVSYWASWLPTVDHLTEADLSEQAGIDFTFATQWCGHQGTPNPTYTSNRQVDVSCGGGDDTLKCTDPARKASFLADPVPLAYTFGPTSELVVDPAVRNAMQIATAAFLQEQADEWQAFNKCPSSCTGSRGTCTPPQDVECNCQVNFFGRMCSVGTGPWGSAFEVSDPGCTPCENGNIQTGGCSCLPGFAAQTFRALNDCSGTHGGHISVCWAGSSEYGGAYQIDDSVPGGVGCRSPNPLTSACSCPAGYTSHGCLRTLVDANSKTVIGSCVFICENLSVAPASFGGSFQMTDYNACMIGNARGGGCSCPSGFRTQSVRVLVDQSENGRDGASIFTCSL